MHKEEYTLDSFIDTLIKGFMLSDFLGEEGDFYLFQEDKLKADIHWFSLYSSHMTSLQSRNFIQERASKLYDKVKRLPQRSLSKKHLYLAILFVSFYSEYLKAFSIKMVSYMSLINLLLETARFCGRVDEKSFTAIRIPYNIYKMDCKCLLTRYYVNRVLLVSDDELYAALRSSDFLEDISSGNYCCNEKKGKFIMWDINRDHYIITSLSIRDGDTLYFV